MPNYVTNIVTVKENIEEFKKSCLDENFENLDFNKIIAEPQDLEIVSGSMSYGYKSDLELKIQMFLKTFYSEELTQEEFFNKVTEELKTKTNMKFPLEKNEQEHYECLVKGYYNLQKYGYKDWYDWRVENWGTKWNAKECYVSEDNNGLHIEFLSAWSTPTCIWDKLAEKFDFTVAFADEDIGCNFGVIIAKDKSVDYNTFEDLSQASKMYTALLIRYGADNDNVDADAEEYELGLPVERQEELTEMIREYV